MGGGKYLGRFAYSSAYIIKVRSRSKKSIINSEVPTDLRLVLVPEVLPLVDGRLDLHAQVDLPGVIEQVRYLVSILASIYHL